MLSLSSIAGRFFISQTIILCFAQHFREVYAHISEKCKIIASRIKVFDTEIPRSIRAAEISAEGKSIFAHDPNGKVAEAYRSLTGEVLKIERQREKHTSDLSR